jgi:NhaP-type Na+/H+ or K+/H+ antiporter
MLTWVIFGGPLLSRLLERVTWGMLIYAVLSLTVVRMVPVFLSLAGTGTNLGGKLFIGWFGPRGLASVVFGVIVFDAGVVGRETIAMTVVCTVLISIILHGATANPLSTTLRRSVGKGG